jgi:hypothetical protein
MATTVVHQRLATKMGGYRWATTGLHVAHSCQKPGKNDHHRFQESARMRAWLNLCPRRTLLMRFYSIENSEPEALPFPLPPPNFILHPLAFPFPLPRKKYKWDAGMVIVRPAGLGRISSH